MEVKAEAIITEESNSVEETSFADESTTCPPGVDIADFTSDEMPSFTIDTSGDASKLSRTLFDTDVVGILEHEVGIVEKQATPEPTTYAQCFNCSGPHQISQCTEPRNQAAINKNRLDFLANAVPKTRYHGDGINKFDHIKPGRISRRLRDAMNLRSKDLPPFIYKMRIHGYPPGWLEEAKMEQSGINIDDGSTAAGEESNGKCATPFQYDIRKILDFPGFNVQAQDYYDRATRERYLPPMQDNHMKQFMIDKLKRDYALRNEALENKIGQRKNSFEEVVYSGNIQSSSLEDLERQKQLLLSQLEMVQDESTVDFTNDDSLTGNSGFVSESTIDLATPSEVETQSQDSVQLEPLNEAIQIPELLPNESSPHGSEPFTLDIDSPVRETNIPSTISKPSLPVLQDSGIAMDGIEASDLKEPAVIPLEPNPSPIMESPRLGSSKRVDYGTPISIRFSPYSRLPKFGNFASGIGDLEMSPATTSIGAYTKVKSVLAERKKELSSMYLANSQQ